MKVLQWFKDRIGKKVVATHETEGTGTVHIADEEHAAYLHKTQSASDYSFSEHNEDDDTITPIVTGVLIGEMLSSSQNLIDGGEVGNDTPAQDDAGTSENVMQGGDFGGGGASGSWEPDGKDSTDNADSTSDNDSDNSDNSSDSDSSSSDDSSDSSSDSGGGSDS